MTKTSSKSLISRLWRDVMGQYRGRLALAVVFMVGLAMAEASFILLTEWIFSGLDPAAGRRFTVAAKDVMIWGPVGVIVLGILQAVFFYLQSVTAQNVAVRCLRDLQKRMFASISRFDLAQNADAGSGQLVSRFTNDMTILRESLTRAPNGLRDIVRLVALVAMLAFQDWVLFASVLLIYPLVGFPVTFIGGKIRKLGRSVQQQIGDMTGLLSENLRAQRMVKTYRLENYERDRLGRTFDDRYTLLNKLIRVRSANEPIITVIGAVAIAAIIGIAAYRIGEGLLTGPQLVSFLIGMAMLSQPARGLGTLNAVLQEGMAALERVYDIMDRTPTITDAAGALPLRLNDQSQPEIAFDAVQFGYDPAVPVIDDFSLRVSPGQTVAFVGPSGAGKSSVFALIPRLYEPQKGAIKIDGQDITKVQIASLRQAIALVAQDAVLYDDSVAANIRFGNLTASEEAVMAAAKAAAAHDFIIEMPDGYESRVGEGGDNLSGGQRQRISLARAFLKDAPILLLDEATAALDAKSERLIEDALKRLSEGRTTFVIAHRLSTVQDADLICVMDQGCIVERGTHARLITEDGLYARLIALQFRQDQTS